MQAPSDESGEGAGDSGAEGAEGVDESTLRVDLCGGGWSQPIGYGWRFQAEVRGLPIQDRLIMFVHVSLDTLVFSQPAAILATQGAPLQSFFPDDSYFSRVDSGRTILEGPFLFLKGRMTPLWDTPLRLRDVVLVHIPILPKDISKEQILGRLVSDLGIAAPTSS